MLLSAHTTWSCPTFPTRGHTGYIPGAFGEGSQGTTKGMIKWINYKLSGRGHNGMASSWSTRFQTNVMPCTFPPKWNRRLECIDHGSQWRFEWVCCWPNGFRNTWKYFEGFIRYGFLKSMTVYVLVSSLFIYPHNIFTATEKLNLIHTQDFELNFPVMNQIFKSLQHKSLKVEVSYLFSNRHKW